MKKVREYKTINCEIGVWDKLFSLKCSRRAKSMNDVLKGLLTPAKPQASSTKGVSVG